MGEPEKPQNIQLYYLNCRFLGAVHVAEGVPVRRVSFA
jgi:hypothetical protein